MQLTTLPITNYRVICPNDDTFNDEFSAGLFDEADEYLNRLRQQHPDKTFELLAVVDA